ncbi:ATP-binding cassette sub-family B member 8, mitochondrial-like [Dendronephthya gigantea]|uniref:ATP-binding cassette sub-family B member 8, mitochondrial-like n=1 Tax=Dendronephthya gigantea TaxID=151771 RepID=UPI00106950ED|nr:ATP-binding cassette sub-family B member 8, mitochondrial-like [Dendronephthya gigantea]
MAYCLLNATRRRCFGNRWLPRSVRSPVEVQNINFRLCRSGSFVYRSLRSLPNLVQPGLLKATKNNARTFLTLSGFVNVLCRKGPKLFSSKYLWLTCTGAVCLKAKLTTAYCSMKLSHKTTPKIRTDIKHDVEAKKKKPKIAFTEFLKFLWPDLWLLVLASFCAFGVALVNVKLPLLLGELVNAVSSLSEGSISDCATLLKAPAKKLVFIYVTQGTLTFVYISLLSSFGERLAARLRNSLFTSLVKQDVQFFDAHKTGELISRLSSDVQDFKSAFKQIVSQGLRSVTQTVGCVVTLFMISPKLTLLIGSLVPSVIICGTLLGSVLRKMSREAQEQLATALAVADESLGNVRTVKAFAMEKKEIGLYTDEVEQSRRLNERLGIGIGAFQGLTNVTINALTLVVLYAGASQLASSELSPGNLMSFLASTQLIQRSMGNISILFGQVIRGLSAGSRVFEYMMLEPKINNQDGLCPRLNEIQGEIFFNNVRFEYPTRPGQKVLRGLNLVVRAGEMVALCGLSGSGKSTVASLIERFYDVDGGSITIDGHNIDKLSPAWIRGELVGYINQEPVLFATSVLENIRYGKPSATDEEVHLAARQANAHDFITKFPEGYETVLGERGVTVSGGQRQRIAIARALLKDPKILILDEATSALDAESERVVQEALDQLTEGRTVLVIAHRLSTIQEADAIAVLSDGKIKELGTHTELIKKNGLYAELVRRQTILLHHHHYQ